MHFRAEISGGRELFLDNDCALIDHLSTNSHFNRVNDGNRAVSLLFNGKTIMRAVAAQSVISRGGETIFACRTREHERMCGVHVNTTGIIAKYSREIRWRPYAKPI